MRKILIFMLCVAISSVLCICAYADANSWASVCEDEDTRVTAELTSLQDFGKTFKINEKHEYLTDWVRGLVSLGKKERIYFCVQNVEYKKDECAFRVISSTYFDKDGAAFLTEKNDDTEWQYALPTSLPGKCWQSHLRYIKFKQQVK